MAKVATKSIAGAPQQEDIEAATKVYEPLFKIESGRTQELGKAKQEAERAALGVEQAKTQAEGERLRAVADFQKGAAEQERITYERAEREIAENPLPDFKPSQPELRNYAQLGSLIATMGLMLGGAKGNALASINAFSGALQGWKAGRKDIYDKEIKKFNLEFNKVKATRDQIMKNLDLGLKKLAAGNKAGLADLEAAKFISGSNSILAKQIDAGNYKAAYETMAATYKLESDTNNKILEMAKAIRQSKEAKALAERQMQMTLAAARIRSESRGGLKPGAEVTKNYLGQNALLSDMQSISKDLKDPKIRKLIDDYRLEGFASEELGKIVAQIANDELPSELRKFLVKVRNVRNNYYLTISGKAVTGGEALRNYGVVAQPGDSAASMTDKTDSMIKQVDRTINQYQKLYKDLPKIDETMIESLRNPTENSTFDVRSIPIEDAQSTGMADAAKAAFGSYDPDKYDYRRDPDTGRMQRKLRE